MDFLPKKSTYPFSDLFSDISDLIKCRKQVGIKTSVRDILAKEGARGLVLGWAPTAIGYSFQGKLV